MPDLFDSYPDDVPIDVCILFERLALEVHALGFKRYSADAILHRIRWHHHVEKRDMAFKANNNWTSDLARWAMKRNPQIGKFFETREQIGKKSEWKDDAA